MSVMIPTNTHSILFNNLLDELISRKESGNTHEYKAKQNSDIMKSFWLSRKGVIETDQVENRRDYRRNCGKHKPTESTWRHFLSSSKDIKEDNISEEGTKPGNCRNHHCLQKTVDEALGIWDENPYRLFVPYRFLQDFVQGRRVDGVGEQTAEKHHDRHDDGSGIVRWNREQDVGHDPIYIASQTRHPRGELAYEKRASRGSTIRHAVITARTGRSARRAL